MNLRGQINKLKKENEELLKTLMEINKINTAKSLALSKEAERLAGDKLIEDYSKPSLAELRGV